MCKSINESERDDKEFYGKMRVIMLLITTFIIGITIPLYRVLASQPEFRIEAGQDTHLWFGTWIHNPDKLDWVNLGENYLDTTVEMIAGHEKFNPRCYPDAGGFSQGYGHKCLGGSITEAYSKQQLKNEVVRLDGMIRYGWTDTQRIGLISFLYNHPLGQRKYVDWINNEADKFKDFLEYKATNHQYINGVRYGGLLVRRQEEWKLIYNQI